VVASFSMLMRVYISFLCVNMLIYTHHAVFSARALRFTSWFQADELVTNLMPVLAGLVTACDLAIAGAMCWFIAKSRTRVTATRSILNKLVSVHNFMLRQILIKPCLDDIFC
jgi:hypothetical protein